MIALVLGLLAQAAAQPATVDPLAPARAGMVICMSPNGGKMTCRAITAYSFGPGGAITTHSETLMTDFVVMKHDAAATLRGGAVCRRITLQDMDRADFVLRGQPASAGDTAALRAEVKNEYADMVGHELCTSFTAARNGVTVRVAMDGVPQTDIADRAIWIDPKAGYRVAP